MNRLSGGHKIGETASLETYEWKRVREDLSRKNVNESLANDEMANFSLKVFKRKQEDKKADDSGDQVESECVGMENETGEIVWRRRQEIKKGNGKDCK